MQTLVRKGKKKSGGIAGGPRASTRGTIITAVIAAVFAAIYLTLARIMSGWTFDTLFIAFFATTLSTFVVRAIWIGIFGYRRR